MVSAERLCLLCNVRAVFFVKRAKPACLLAHVPDVDHCTLNFCLQFPKSASKTEWKGVGSDVWSHRAAPALLQAQLALSWLHLHCSLHVSTALQGELRPHAHGRGCWQRCHPSTAAPGQGRLCSPTKAGGAHGSFTADLGMK